MDDPDLANAWTRQFAAIACTKKLKDDHIEGYDITGKHSNSLTCGGSQKTERNEIQRH